MPTYEYRCRVCDERFELRRSMEQADHPAQCPQGHGDTVRLLSVFAAVTTSAGASGGDQTAGRPCSEDCACFPPD